MLLGLDKCRVKGNAIHRTNLLALGFVKMANAFGAAIGIYLVNAVALINGFVGALRLTHVTVNAFLSNN
ncbi:MAG: hypothetical protein ACJA1T_001140 [Zhongshania aliphaticivorans]